MRTHIISCDRCGEVVNDPEELLKMVFEIPIIKPKVDGLKAYDLQVDFEQPQPGQHIPNMPQNHPLNQFFGTIQPKVEKTKAFGYEICKECMKIIMKEFFTADRDIKKGGCSLEGGRTG